MEWNIGKHTAGQLCQFFVVSIFFFFPLGFPRLPTISFSSALCVFLEVKPMLLDSLSPPPTVCDAERMQTEVRQRRGTCPEPLRASQRLFVCRREIRLIEVSAWENSGYARVNVGVQQMLHSSPRWWQILAFIAGPAWLGVRFFFWVGTVGVASKLIVEKLRLLKLQCQAQKSDESSLKPSSWLKSVSKTVGQAVYVVVFFEFRVFNWMPGDVVSYVPVNSSADHS